MLRALWQRGAGSQEPRQAGLKGLKPSFPARTAETEATRCLQWLDSIGPRPTGPCSAKAMRMGRPLILADPGYILLP